MHTQRYDPDVITIWKYPVDHFHSIACYCSNDWLKSCWFFFILLHLQHCPKSNHIELNLGRRMNFDCSCWVINSYKNSFNTFYYPFLPINSSNTNEGGIHGFIHGMMDRNLIWDGYKKWDLKDFLTIFHRNRHFLNHCNNRMRNLVINWSKLRVIYTTALMNEWTSTVLLD